jgi:hypothetical protein
MNWLNRLAALLFGLITVGIVRDFLDKHTVIVLDKESSIDIEDDEDVEDVVNLKPENYDHAMDLRGTPTHICPCGCEIFNLKVIFHENEIATYFLDMECANCGSLATAPTPIDNKEGLDN